MIYDISLPVTETLASWPGQAQPAFTFTSHQDRGDHATGSHLSMSAHTGTHLDAPLHFVPGGVGVDHLDLEKLIGPATVVHALEADAITANVLESLAIPPGTSRLLIRTRNSDWWAQGDDREFHTDYVAIEPDAADWIVAHDIVCVGVDYLSVGPWGNGTPTHVTLLSNGVIPVEGLNLHGIERGAYQFICLPLKLKDRDGAPCRAVLVR